jgi:hypothetical protein
VFVVVSHVVRLSNSLSPAVFVALNASLAALSASSFSGIPGSRDLPGSRSSVILSPSYPSSFLMVSIFRFFVPFLSDAASSVLKESVAMSSLSGSFIVEWMTVIIADCSTLNFVFLVVPDH